MASPFFKFFPHFNLSQHSVLQEINPKFFCLQRHAWNAALNEEKVVEEQMTMSQVCRKGRHEINFINIELYQGNLANFIHVCFFCFLISYCAIRIYLLYLLQNSDIFAVYKTHYRSICKRRKSKKSWWSKKCWWGV